MTPQPYGPPDHTAHGQNDEVPLTVWACAQHTARTPSGERVAVLHAGNLRAELARRIITAFSQSGDLVVDPTCGLGVTLSEAARLNRFAIGIATDERWARLTNTYLDHACTTRERQRIHMTIASTPNELVKQHGEVDLVLSAPPTRWALPAQAGIADGAESPEPGEHAESIAGTYARWARLLRPGGLLVTVTRPTRVNGTMPKITGTTVQLAQQADLRYVQHVIALRIPVRDGSLAVLPGRPRTRRYGERTGGPRVCRVVHDDVLVFAKPRRPRPREVGQ